MSHPYLGPLSNYNSLTDKHLTGYFNNTRIRRHLQRAGLITRSGKILTEKEYRINAMRRDHQKYIRECLAQAIFHKVIDMERRHQIDIKRKLEMFARKERVLHRRTEYSRRSEEDTLPAFSPRPPTGPKSGMHRRFKNRELSDSSESASTPRPNTAPENIQRPVRLKPLPVYSSSGNVQKSSGSHQKNITSDDEDHHHRSETEKYPERINTTELSFGISPYRLPIINNFVMPVPPPPQKHPKQNRSTMSRGRRYRPTTAPNGLEVTGKETTKFHKTSLHSNVKITMVYLGKNVHLNEYHDHRDEIKVFQQHCGGENLCVYKGRLLEGECFNLVSRRHRGFPFSLTFYINGIQAERLSSCCEFKHRKGARLGGKHGYFRFINTEGATPCYRCIIALGLDNKPSPPPPRSKGEKGEEKVKEEEEEEEDHSLSEAGNDVMETTYYDEVDNKLGRASSFNEEDDTREDKSVVDCEEEGDNKDGKSDAYEADDDETKDEYDEDFEEECKPDEKCNEDGQADDQVDGKSKSPSDNEKDDLDQERRSNTPSKAAPEASDSDGDESDRRSDSDDEEHKQGRHSAADEEMNTAARKIQSLYRQHRSGRPHSLQKKPDRKQTEPYSTNNSLDRSSSEHDSNDEDDDMKDTKWKKKKLKKELEEPEDLTDLEKEPKLEKTVDEKEEDAIDEGDKVVKDNTKDYADQTELEYSKGDSESNQSSLTENEEKKGDDGTLDVISEEHAKVEDDLDNESEDGGEYRL